MDTKRSLGGFYITTGVVLALLVGFYFSWVPLKRQYWAKEFCSADTWKKRHFAMHKLTALGPDALPAIEGLLDPRDKKMCYKTLDTLGYHENDITWMLPLLMERVCSSDKKTAGMGIVAAARAGEVKGIPDWYSYEGADPSAYSGVTDPREIQRLDYDDSVIVSTYPLRDDLPVSDEAMKQGRNRLERARNFVEAARKLAAEHKSKLGWELREVPGVAHSSSGMSPEAAAALFGEE